MRIDYAHAAHAKGGAVQQVFEFLQRAFKMKHELLAKRIIAELHEPWMDDKDKAEFDAEIMSLFGAQFDEAIDDGIAKGYSESQQESMVKPLFNALRTPPKEAP